VRGPVEHELAPVLPMHLVDLGARVALQAVDVGLHPLELVLEPQHLLDAGEVQASSVVSRWIKPSRSRSRSE